MKFMKKSNKKGLFKPWLALKQPLFYDFGREKIFISGFRTHISDFGLYIGDSS